MKMTLLVAIVIVYLAFDETCSAQPVITKQPENQTNFVGTTATFTVEVTGLAPLGYQWQQAADYVNFVDRLDGTNSALTITNIQHADSAYYRAIVTNSEGAVTSSPAILYVIDPPTLGFNRSSYSVSEDAGSVTVEVLRTGYLDSAVTVDYVTADLTATNGIKYTAASGTLAFGPGDQTKPIIVPILDEASIEGIKVFRVLLSDPTGGAVVGTAFVMVSITDDDRPLQLTAGTYTVSEEAGFVEIGVTRGDDGDFPVTVELITADGSALAGADYESVTNRLEFAPGEYLKVASIRILNDAIREPSESFRVELRNPTGGGQTGSPSVATVTISDTDGVVQLEHANYLAGEGTGFVRVGILCGELSDNSTVDIQTSDLSASTGLDYTGLTNTLTFAPGERLQLIDIPILNDGLKEADEIFRVTIRNPTGGLTLRTLQTSTVKIRDNDPGIQFAGNQVWVLQQDGSVTLTVTRGNDQILEPFTVNYATTSGTAIAGRDYVETSGTLAFAAAEMTRALTVPILDDGVPRPDRSFQVALSNPTGGPPLGVGAAITAGVTLCDVREMLPHRSKALQISLDGTATLTLGGGYTPGLGVVNRFQPFIDLYSLEASSDLLDWSALATMARTNAVTNLLVHTESVSTHDSQRFYRVPAKYLITPNLPPTGPYAVGRIDRWLSDQSRRNRFLVATNGSFQVAVWYPATPRAGSTPLPCNDEPVLHDNTYWPDWTDRAPSLVGYAAGGLDLAPAQTRYPVVLFSPGYNGVRHDPLEQAEELASHGYVVVAPDHYDSWGVVLPDGTYSSGGEGKELSAAGFADRVRDLSFIIDQMEDWNATDPFFAGRLDLEKIGAIGFSWGGGVAAEFCRVDSRGRAAVVLDSSFQNATTLLAAGLPKPVLSVYRSGLSDSRLFDKLARDAVWFQIKDTVHLDIGGFGWYPSGTLTTTRLAWEVNEIVNAYTVWFLDKYLKARSNPMPSPQAYPRVINFKQK